MADNKENKAVKETATRGTANKKIGKKNKIYFFNEKKWIMAYWFKTMGRRKAQYTVNYLREQWTKWWENDSGSISNEMLKETVRPMSKDEVANYAQRGHPFRLSGTAIPFLTVRSTAIV